MAFLHLLHSTCTWKPTKHHQTLPSPCVILKVIRAGVGWVWLARLEIETSCTVHMQPRALVGSTALNNYRGCGLIGWRGGGVRTN